jgi:hypothetical protein
VLKRIRFAASASTVPVDWHAVRGAPAAIRPSRVTVATALLDVDAHPRHPAVRIEWFQDSDHLSRYDSWAAGTGLVRPDLESAVVADERVLRGADWLADHWRYGGGAVKQMAIAHRAIGLTQQQFSQQWQARAGSVGSTPIPDSAKGCAYVQNHPLHDQRQAYDAVNEVYFDDLDGLRARMAWFTETMSVRAEDDLISANWFLALHEELVTGDST